MQGDARGSNAESRSEVGWGVNETPKKLIKKAKALRLRWRTMKIKVKAIQTQMLITGNKYEEYVGVPRIHERREL